MFPVQSRVTGAKYSYQWMALAQQNNWHVLLDAGALGPKDMDSLGLSLFRPDFIITSFYRVFGYDPTGFGCLLIKKSAMGSLQNKSGHAGSGIVKITPVFPQYMSDSMDNIPGFGEEDEEFSEVKSENRSQLPAFSGAYTSAQVRDVFDEMEHDNSSDRDGASTIFEETESISVGDMMKSPVFSDESSDNSLWIDLGQSPLGSDHSNKHKGSSPLPPAWFSTRKNNKLTSESNGGQNEDPHVLSFDAAVRSVSQDLDHFKEIPEDEPYSERSYRTPDNRHFQEIEEEGPEIKNSEICVEKENAIRRETEGEFRLLERREKSRIAGGRRVSFSTEDNHGAHMGHDESSDDDDYLSNGEYGDQDSERNEPEIICRHLDHINMLGLNKTTSRLRFLINWLVTSLLQLRINGKENTPLVHIYGPKIKYERGAAVAFNVRDRNRGLISPEVVQKLAESSGISLGVGILSHIRIVETSKRGSLCLDDTTLCRPMENGGQDSKSGFIRVEVVTASLSFLSNFDDVYKLWAFVAKFIDPLFVKEGALAPVAEDVEE